MKILAVEDSIDCQRLIQIALGAKFQIEFCQSSAQALVAARSQDFSLYLIDVNLPDRNGFELCQELQSQSRTQSVPVIFLSGQADAPSIVMGLNIGADDYVTKPFNSMELLARVESKISKVRQQKVKSEEIVVGPIRLDLMRQKFYIDKNSVDFTPTEFRMLKKFVLSPGQVFSRQQLIDEIFGAEHFIVDRGVDKHISSIRKKLGDYQNAILTVPGVGYEFQLPGGPS